MLRLHHREKAGRPFRVRWALEEAGADYDFAVMTQEEGAGDEHKQRHPLGRVPVLETDDGFLFESAALCLQVADLHPGAKLIPPPGTYERGLVYQWTVFAMSELEPAVIRAYSAAPSRAASGRRSSVRGSAGARRSRAGRGSSRRRPPGCRRRARRAAPAARRTPRDRSPTSRARARSRSSSRRTRGSTRRPPAP